MRNITTLVEALVHIADPNASDSDKSAAVLWINDYLGKVVQPSSAHHQHPDDTKEAACQCYICAQARTRTYQNGYNKALEFMQEAIRMHQQ